ncbi:polycystic kidney disease 1-like 2, partial [Cichlidogyrus casuarinus]
MVRNLGKSDLLPDGPPFQVNTESGNMSIAKVSRNGKYATSTGEYGIQKVPNLCDDLGNSTTCSDTSKYEITITTSSSFVNSKLFASSHSIPVPITSGSVSMEVHVNGKVATVSQSSKPFIINIPQSAPTNFAPIDGNTEGLNPQLPDARIAVDGTEMLTANVAKVVNSAITFELLPRNISKDNCPKYLVVNSFIDPPNVGWEGSINSISHWTVLPTSPKACAEGASFKGANPWAMFIDNTMFDQLKRKARERAARRLTKNEKNTVYLGYRQIPDEEYFAYRNGSQITVPYPNRDQVTTYTEVRSFISSCVFYNETTHSWSRNGCNVSALTMANKIVCECNHLTSFSSDWINLPNTIDFNYAFLLLAIWARWKDKKDLQELGLTVLAENEIDDEYLYEIFVSTGKRGDAGTDSTVHLRISGEEGETVALRLKDPQRKVLQRGQINRFLLAVPGPLGQLKFIRLWHDNSGNGSKASWFCNYVTVTDLQTKLNSHFIVDRWFAVEKPNSDIDQVVSVSGPADVLRLTHLFGKTMSMNLTEGHLWISIFSRLAHSRFTRLERVGCCLLLIFLSMLTGCMFYRNLGPAVDKNVLTLGPFSISSGEISNSLFSSLITFVPVFIVVEIFRRSRLYSSYSKKLVEAIEKHFDEPFDVNFNERGLLQTNSRIQTALSTSEKSIKITRRLLPWQLRIVAWMIIFLTLAVSVFFVTFYGISFGSTACGKWLSSLSITFIMSIMIVQPAKAMLLALFVSLVCPSLDRVEEIEFLDEEELIMNQLQVRYLASVTNMQRSRMQYLADQPEVKKTMSRGYEDSSAAPLDPETVARAKEIRPMEIRMNDILREVGIHVVFFICLMLFASKFTSPDGYQLNAQLTKTFFSEDQFYSIHTENDVWKWLNESVLPNLLAGSWYNGNLSNDLRGFLADRSNRMIGYARLRQLRVKPKNCDAQFTISQQTLCYPGYSMHSQEEGNFMDGWQRATENRQPHPWFTYNSADTLGGYPFLGIVEWYSAGGYPVKLTGT